MDCNEMRYCKDANIIVIENRSLIISSYSASLRTAENIPNSQ